MGITIVIILFAAAVFLCFRYVRSLQLRKRLSSAPLSTNQRLIIEDEVPIIRKLPPEYRKKLEGKINLFLHQVDFIGCGDLEITEEIRLSIAAQACLLVVNSDAWYETLRTILVYPGAFKSREREQNGYVTTEKEVVRTGESWVRGPVILSWTHARLGALNDKDGKNVVLHEFAHQLDALSGQTDGRPVLRKGQSFAEWEQAFLAGYIRHVKAVQRGRRTVLDHYGAESPQEFFAVAVEIFFEKPLIFMREEPKIYLQFADLLQLDPCEWE